ncbi:SGNH/GDSL hydrolase family protein [Aspergillus mulundensis]|uniref:Carbohydrate esterase family 16 protein n=1 Tax=Aspergillus mulundensis TaxID=1810919 RepID=A0A3D8S5L1_9EURO|nr:Uncharacterized protein DSM5745_05136 [Aspergillus mulundensis]RDW81579.1 Uncharacterized protein DSM5745_05136 [Aspergillus mulundensis]
MRVQDVLGILGSIPSPFLKTPDASQGPPVRYLFSFGNSYTTTSYNVSSTQPSPENPMGNPPLGSGTAAPGLNWVGYLATEYNDTTVLSYNHAVYGATVNNTLTPNPSVPDDLAHQVSRVFEPHYCLPAESGVSWTPAAALFTVWMGINDVLFLSDRTDPVKDIPEILDSYFNLIDRMHDCGARDFLLFNIPPCDRTPQILLREPVQILAYDALTREFNRQLRDAAEDWGSANRDASISVFDAWAFFTEILDAPQKYGFTDNECMGPGCFWFDDFHPMSPVHQLLAADVSRFLGWDA